MKLKLVNKSIPLRDSGAYCRPLRKVNVPSIHLGSFSGHQGFLVKKSACNLGDLALIPGLGRSPGGRHGNPFQYSCLENPMERGAWWATVHEVAKSWTRLND